MLHRHFRHLRFTCKSSPPLVSFIINRARPSSFSLLFREGYRYRYSILRDSSARAFPFSRVYSRRVDQSSRPRLDDYAQWRECFSDKRSAKTGYKRALAFKVLVLHCRARTHLASSTSTESSRRRLSAHHRHSLCCGPQPLRWCLRAPLY